MAAVSETVRVADPRVARPWEAKEIAIECSACHRIAFVKTPIPGARRLMKGAADEHRRLFHAGERVQFQIHYPRT